MGIHYQPILTFLSLILVTSHAASSPGDYWKSMLPNTPMPKIVKNILPPADWLNDQSPSINLATLAANVDPSMIPHGVCTAFGEPTEKHQFHFDPRETLVFFEKDIRQGKVMNLHLTKSSNNVIFLPQQLAQSIPFSSRKLPQILKDFSIEPNSQKGKIMKNTIKLCEKPGVKGEEKYCATSLESMINFSTSKLGKDVQALSAELEKENHLQTYRITKVTKVGARDQTITCHPQNYAYAVFNCHKLPSTKAYVVSLDREDGTKGKAIAVCHQDTSTWHPKHITFQILKVKPGSVPICHFLEASSILWVPN